MKATAEQKSFLKHCEKARRFNCVESFFLKLIICDKKNHEPTTLNIIAERALSFKLCKIIIAESVFRRYN